MSDHDPKLEEAPEPMTAPERPFDTGSEALTEALRSSFWIVKVVMFLLLIVFLGSGFFTVEPQEQAMIIRLGKPVGEGKKALLGPGLHWSFPYPIDEYVKVPISAIQHVYSTVGWYATTPEQEVAGTEEPSLPVGYPLNPLVDGFVLTADRNIVHTRATLTYHIADPVTYVFNFVNASNAVQSALDNALIYAASTYKVDDLLTRDVAGFKEAVRKRVVQLVNQQNLGIDVEECLIQSRAPRQLKDAFDSVLKAALNRQKLLEDARSYEAQVSSKAGADARSMINLAESDRSRLVSEVRSQADRFNDLLPKFKQNPRLFVQQRLTDTIGRVLTNAQDTIFVTEGQGGNPKEFRLLLNRPPPKQSTGETKP
ncbi:MAG TPA: protease modulator HflK [Verrucomicrobiae bacterium]|nr:protease modulator HflK [Verrucomicrobiae bacterium]